MIELCGARHAPGTHWPAELLSIGAVRGRHRTHWRKYVYWYGICGPAAFGNLWSVTPL